MVLVHLKKNLVAYVALAVALGTGTAYAANLPNGSVTNAKIRNNAVTSTKVKNGTLKPKDLKKPTWVQTSMSGTDTPPAVPDVVSVAPYDFTLPTTGRTAVTVFLPALTGDCGGGGDRPRVGLYLDNVPVPGTQALVPADARSVQLTATLELSAGAHAARVGITCPGAPLPDPSAPGAKSWTIIQADD